MIVEAFAAPTPDLPALRKLWDWVQEQHELNLQGKPSEWDQHWYMTENSPMACGTVCCVAGKHIASTRKIRAYGSLAFQDETGWHDFWHTAKDELGLTTNQAHALFYGSNTFEDVHQVMKSIFEDAGDKL